jgi:PPOX class probable F420-dependent enzyme
MMIPEKFADLFTKEKRALAYLALVKKDGTPQVTPVWFDYDGTQIIVNTARGRVKDKILKRHPRVALAIQDPANLYRYIQIRGKVVEETEVGGYEMICLLAEKYRGKREFPMKPGDVRVTYKILPDHFNGKE